MVKVVLKIKIFKEVNGALIELFENEIETENSYKGVGAALLGWTSLHAKESQKIYQQDFGKDYDEFNLRAEVSLKENGVEVLNEGKGLYLHFYGQLRFVMAGIKGTNTILCGEVNKFIKEKYR